MVIALRGQAVVGRFSSGDSPAVRLDTKKRGRHVHPLRGDIPSGPTQPVKRRGRTTATGYPVCDDVKGLT